MKLYLLFTLALLTRILWVFVFEQTTVYKQGTVIVLEGQLDKEPEIVNGNQKFRLNGVYVTAKNEPRIHFGDEVSIKGKISKNSLYYPAVNVVSKNKLNGWWVVASDLKQAIQTVYRESLPRQQADLLAGIVLGGKGVDRGVKERLTSVGLSHVIAASGMNLSFVAGIAFFVLQPLGIRKIYKVMIAIVFISFYATITGFEPPIVRALIMSLVVTISGLLGRQSSMSAGLAIAVFIMLWVDPKLTMSASFLLSLSATIAQICFSGLKFSVPGLVVPIIEIILQSLFSTIFTLPIIIIFFARFSLVSVFINPIVLWTIEPLMVLGGLAGIMGIVWMEAGKFLLLPAGVLLSFFFKMVDLAIQTPIVSFRFSFRETYLGVLFMAGYYLLSTVLVVKVRKLLAPVKP